MGKKIGFVCYGGGHINIILPVLDRCMKAGFNVELIALTGAKPVAKKLGYSSLGYKDFVPRQQRAHITSIAKPLIKENFNPSSGITLEESLCYLGVNWFENINRYGIQLTRRLYKKIGRHSFLPIKKKRKKKEK